MVPGGKGAEPPNDPKVAAAVKKAKKEQDAALRFPPKRAPAAASVAQPAPKKRKLRK